MSLNEKNLFLLGQFSRRGRQNDDMPALRRRAAAAASGQANDRFSGVYVHSNPPRVFKSPNMKDPVSTGLGFKKSNIRIWIHNMNIKNLQQVVWEGCGSQLLVEPSNNPKVKRFLEAIPHMMGMIRDIHVDVQNDDLESLKNHVSAPVPPVVLTGKDQNGLTALHKAAGLGRHEIAEFIVGELPNTVKAVDNEGRTPLHYSVLVKDNNKMFDLLLQNGASESALDNRQKAAAYYKTRHSEIDSKVLNVVPDCPRSGKSQAVDWNIVDPSTPRANGMKGSETNLSERSNKEEKVSDETKESEKRLKRSQNLEEEMNNNEAKNEESAVNTNGNHDEENTILDIEEDKPKENEEEEPPNELEQTASNGKLSNEPSVENDYPEEPSSPKKTENENDTEEEPHMQSEKDEEVNNETENNEESNENNDESNENNETNIEEPENNETHADDEKEESNKISTTEFTNNDEEGEPTQNEETITEGSRTRPSSKNFLQNSRQNSSAKSEKSRPGSGYRDKENGDLENGEGVIEGIVNGEDEVEPVNNEGFPRKDNESVTSLIKNGNMEQLAALVLNGEGEKLVGQRSDNAELQSFLENVPVYMNKIHTIHLAARSGNLRELQAALDRRKFAVARDNVSPNGATPLHVAVTFGRTSIVRYLAGRFPETLQVEDDMGRIPLHYAAMLRDNGHYYNLLVHLGSNAKAQDKNGMTPEYYMKHPNEFNHKKLLEEFGAAKEESDEILKDQVRADKGSARKPLDDEDMLGVLERCYNVLQGSRRDSDKVSTLSQGRIESSSVNGTARNYFNRYIFDEVKTRLTKLDHNLYDIIWPSVKRLPSDATFREALDHDFPLGIVAPDIYVYHVFQEFLDPIINASNQLDPKKEIGPQPESKFRESDQADNIELDLDPSEKWVMTDTSEDNEQMTMPFFATEEGRYLASSLGDPLIKGLTEVATKRPNDPIAYLATYLYQFAQNGKSAVHERGQEKVHQQIVGGPQIANDNEAVPGNVNMTAVESSEGDDETESNFNGTSRDEHGQSMVHFAAARSHGRNALFQLLLETEISVAFRDELYRTARDISIQANIPENTTEIDRYVLHIATTGDTNKLVELLLEGYDHITDIIDEDDTPIVEAVTKANQSDTLSFLQSVLAFEEKRERVHHAIRQGTLNEVMTLLADEKDTGSGKLLAIGKNNYGRCSLHIAVLCQQEEIVDYLANTFLETLKIGDNLERTALHYAMGVEKMDSISKVLIKAGARRVTKDLKGRQPTYYFLNKTDILRLQEEEEMF